MFRYLRRLLNLFTGRQLSTGHKGEEAAAAWLRNNGMRILRRNWRYRRNEIDIIAQEDQTLVFVEVKAAEAEPDQPLSARLTREQIRRLRQAAHVFIKQNRLNSNLWRFDLITVVLGDGSKPEITHTPDAF